MELFSVQNLFTLLMLIFLQAVLGFDNLLYISLESKRVPADQQQFVRRAGIGLAIFLRIGLLFAVVHVIELFQDPFWVSHVEGLFAIQLNIHSLIVLIGGVFIVYTASKEITHMLTDHDLDGKEDIGSARSKWVAVAWIVGMNIVFSFDSILSAIALTDVFPVMAIAIITSGLMMMFLADRVAEFLEQNRKYEVLGLFILLIVGVMLLSEGGELAHLHLFTYEVEAMSKTTFYFAMAILVIVDVAQGKHEKIEAKKKAA